MPAWGQYTRGRTSGVYLVHWGYMTEEPMTVDLAVPWAILLLYMPLH